MSTHKTAKSEKAQRLRFEIIDTGIGIPFNQLNKLFEPFSQVQSENAYRYSGTGLGKYCNKYGHYTGNNDDTPRTFFERSILNFPNKWVGKGLSLNNSDWLSDSELTNYKDNLQFLRDFFDFFAIGSMIT